MHLTFMYDIFSLLCFLSLKELLWPSKQEKTSFHFTSKAFSFFRHSNCKIFRRISIQWISVARITHFAGECFLFNLHLKRMKSGRFVNPRFKNLILTIALKIKLSFGFRSIQHEVLCRIRCSVSFYLQLC